MSTRLLFATSFAELLHGDAGRVEATIQCLERVTKPITITISTPSAGLQ